MAGKCGWKIKGRTRCDRPTVALRDLGPAYAKVRMQYVCKLRANFVDGRERLLRRLPREDEPPADVPEF
jgi:hypothetical protein